jgi:hypothetical protein
MGPDLRAAVLRRHDEPAGDLGALPRGGEEERADEQRDVLAALVEARNLHVRTEARREVVLQGRLISVGESETKSETRSETRSETKSETKNKSKNARMRPRDRWLFGRWRTT